MFSKNTSRASEHAPLGPFFKLTLMLAVPIALQNLLTSCAALIDTAMVVSLGNTAVSAIGVAGRFPFFINLACFGLCSGSATMISQYWGARDLKGIHRTFGFLTALAMVFAFIMSFCLFSFPQQLMKIFIDDPAVIALGAQYLRIFSIGTILTVINQFTAASLRATEQVTLPLISSRGKARPPPFGAQHRYRNCRQGTNSFDRSKKRHPYFSPKPRGRDSRRCPHREHRAGFGDARQ